MTKKLSSQNAVTEQLSWPGRKVGEHILLYARLDHAKNVKDGSELEMPNGLLISENMPNV